MADGMFRIGIVGATSLVGKELAEELGESLLAASDFVLLDGEEAAGQVTALGDEPAVIETVTDGSFGRMDFAFFAAEAELTTKHWMAARRAGASIVDLSYALELEAGVLVRAPLIASTLAAAAVRGHGAEAQARPNLAKPNLAKPNLAKPNLAKPNLSTPAIVAAHPAAVMLALVAARLAAKLEVRNLAAVVFEPASAHTRETMDELHQQTVNLLSFKDLPRTQYDAQVAFNLLPVLGDAATVSLADSTARIMRHYAGLGDLPELAVELVQAPVFHGYTASVLVEFNDDVTFYEVERALEGESIDVVGEGGDPPSNLSAAGQEDVMVRVRSAAAGAEDKPTRRFWLWLAADNLKLHALNAIACANELKRLRPRATVQ